MNEADRIHERYARRTRTYEPWAPWVQCTRHELERAIARTLVEAGQLPPADTRLLEVGCGGGDNLLGFLRLGFQPGNLVGSELQAARADAARRRLPAALRVHQGDSTQLDLPPSSFDVVFQSLVFSSILDAGMREALARRMWELTAPGGGVLWYDFTWDNPSNPDVRGVTRREVESLFPGADVRCRRVTLAPPISRRVTRVHPGLYTWCNVLPWLRTHVLCWIGKPGR